MQIEIVTIGNEVLSGRTVDTNFAFLARALEEVSVQVGWHSTVGDTAERIAEGLSHALDRADAVVMTGGLGPTPDDVTRKAVASLLGRPLQLDETVLEHIRTRARRFKRKLPASFEAQALIPRGAEVWENAMGTAPGILIVHRDKPVILMPGVPQEMEYLATTYVVPYLRERSGRAVETFTLRTAGVFESQLHEKIGVMPNGWPGAFLAYLPSYFGVDLRVTVAGGNAEHVRTVTGRAYDELRALVGAVVYGEGGDTMEQVVGTLLVEKGWTIATAESCTGGLLAKRLTDVAGSSRYVERGFVTYSNASKVALLGVSEDDLAAHGAVSAPVAEQMARGARERAGTQVGVGITGVAGPEGGSEEKPVGTVFIAVSSPGGDAVRKLFLPGSRTTVRERSVQIALDLVRRSVAGLPLEPRLDCSEASMRIFLAVFPPPAAQQLAYDVIEMLRKPGDGVSWVKKENLHYTLKFLGEIGDDGLRRVSEAARTAAAAVPAFDAELGECGAFPHGAGAKVLWIGLARGAEPFITLEEQLEAALASAGWARDPRGFTPHLTIGRVREPGRDWSTVLDGVGSLGERALAAFRVDRIRVVRSEMHPGGSTYHTVGEAVLAEP